MRVGLLAFPPAARWPELDGAVPGWSAAGAGHVRGRDEQDQPAAQPPAECFAGQAAHPRTATSSGARRCSSVRPAEPGGAVVMTGWSLAALDRLPPVRWRWHTTRGSPSVITSLPGKAQWRSSAGMRACGTVVSCSGRSTARAVRSAASAHRRSSAQPRRSPRTNSTQPRRPAVTSSRHAPWERRRASRSAASMGSSVGQVSRSTGKDRNRPVASTSASQLRCSRTTSTAGAGVLFVPASSHGLQSRHPEHDRDRKAVRLRVGVAARGGGQLASPVVW